MFVHIVVTIDKQKVVETDVEARNFSNIMCILLMLQLTL